MHLSFLPGTAGLERISYLLKGSDLVSYIVKDSMSPRLNHSFNLDEYCSPENLAANTCQVQYYMIDARLVVETWNRPSKVLYLFLTSLDQYIIVFFLFHFLLRMRHLKI